MALGTSIKQALALDVRALALQRMGVAAVLLYDLVDRARHLTLHYTDAGVLPLSGWHQLTAGFPYLCLHAWRGSASWELMLFALAGLLAVGLLVGWHTRWMTVGCWLLTTSLQNRNFFISQAGDDLLRLLLFWGMFLPWGRCWSWDAGHGPAPASTRYLGLPALALTLQLLAMYVTTGLHKTGPDWVGGQAVYYALSLDQLRKPLGDLIYPYAGLLSLLTYSTCWLEVWGPLLWLLPWGPPWWRTASILLFASFHIGTGLTLMLGIFPLVCLAGLVGLLPPKLMDKIGGVPTATIPAALPVLKRRWLRLATVAGAMLLLSWWNLHNLWPALPLPQPVKQVAFALRMDQNWDMFSPGVYKNDGWLLAEATLQNGKVLDIFQQDSTLHLTKPQHITHTYQGDRCRKYTEVLLGEDSLYKQWYAQALIHAWDAKHGPIRKVKQLQLIYMLEPSLPHYHACSIYPKQLTVTPGTQQLPPPLKLAVQAWGASLAPLGHL